jgi:hypothetical protein
MTLRLSSACSNQLSYRPFRVSDGSESRPCLGGKGIRTPDIQLAKLALYQLSYAPGVTHICFCDLSGAWITI